MKLIKLYSSILTLLAILSCSTNDINNNQNGLANFQTTCVNGNGNNTLTGPTGAYYKYAQTGVIPLTQVPILQNPQLLPFPHSSPLFVITLPQGYKGEESRPLIANAPFPLGIDIDRNDGAVTWDYVPSSTYPPNFGVNDIMKVVIDNMLNTYDFNGIDDVVCSINVPQSFSGINFIYASRFLRFGRFTAIVWINVKELPFGNFSVTSSVSAGPTNEFDRLVLDIFLPLSNQLLVGGGSLSDRDNDGTPDIYDREPDNPNIQ
ncbi:hypothetical protein [uncultured Algibacter sp.]|uniref:hypothetical protein n=1 Tax=uncultured Algibacter sp. TaxID=298659 RepID=UPI00261FC576|nr:hypothetical protein [uncultured Algibacter sp.]